MKWLILLIILAGCSVQPNPQPQPLPNEGLTPGAVLGLVLDAQMVVIAVDPAGGAAQAGIMPGDLLLTVNDLVVADNIQQVKQLIAVTGAGSSIVVAIERQGQRLIVDVAPLPPQPAPAPDGAALPTATPVLPSLIYL